MSIDRKFYTRLIRHHISCIRTELDTIQRQLEEDYDKAGFANLPAKKTVRITTSFTVEPVDKTPPEEGQSYEMPW